MAMGKNKDFKKLVVEGEHSTRMSVYISMDDETRKVLIHLIDRATNVGGKIELEAKVPDGTSVTVRVI